MNRSPSLPGPAMEITVQSESYFRKAGEIRESGPVDTKV